LAIEVDIAKLEAERAKFEDGTKEWIEITQKIQKL
jgi:hypothetical protein